ncbi:MAG: formylglycine-generating enzyme family protein [Treponema sp.]|nr:formylglycine-generating enzyme family protein [Treponema sp.]
MKKFIFLLFIACFLLIACASKQEVAVAVEEPKVAVVDIPKIYMKQITKMVLLNDGYYMILINKNSNTHRQIDVDSFFLGVYTVTQSEYQEVMDANPSFFKGETLPVENVTWSDAIDYCNRLSKREGLTPVYERNENNVTWNRSANGYRLPTDDEWEYACRAGTTTPFNTGNTISSNQANYDGRYAYNTNVRGEYRAKTTPVGTFAANAWGLFDMHGNVWEWCWDNPNDAQSNTLAVNTGSIRVIRGGGWSSSGVSLHSSYRSGYQPLFKNNYVGFRIARNAK